MRARKARRIFKVAGLSVKVVGLSAKNQTKQPCRKESDGASDLALAEDLRSTDGASGEPAEELPRTVAVEVVAARQPPEAVSGGVVLQADVAASLLVASELVLRELDDRQPRGSRHSLDARWILGLVGREPSRLLEGNEGGS